MKFFVMFLCFTIWFTAQLGDVKSVPGGLNNISVNEVKKYVPKIEKFFNEKTNDSKYGIHNRLVSAQSQVVAGVRYIIVFDLDKTNCEKADVLKQSIKAADCQKTETIKNCVADVIVRAWEKYEEVTEMKCGDVITDFYT